MKIKELLDQEVCGRNCEFELSYDKPDPLLVARRQNDEYAILLCALFGYGKASLIVKFLDSLDFSLLDFDEESITKAFQNHYYRFQTSADVIAIFIAFSKLKKSQSLEDIFYSGYKEKKCVLEGIDSVIKAVNNIHTYSSQGYTFLLGSPLKRDRNGDIKSIGNAPYKRWNMFLRWMVRSDKLDLGLWKRIDKKDLILPLDTHTFNVSLRLGLLSRKTYDLQSALLITEKLKEFDENDPIKYDFALYRLGQEKMA